VFNIVTGWFVAVTPAVPSRVSPNPVIVPPLTPTMPPGETNDWTEFEFGPAFGLMLVPASVFVVPVFTTAPPVTLNCCANAGADDANESAATDVIKAKRRFLGSLLQWI
jgi:hypothetical protein